jgi:dual specificity tyrosine-phosphorylation-regulated kinase 1
MYSYIQSRFYRSPEVMLGLPYSVAIDVWSLGCILAEMHTGEPLFSGSDQFDQMQKIVKILGMVPNHMIDRAGEQQKNQFFERARTSSGLDEWTIRQTNTTAASGTSKSSSSATTATSVSTPQSKQTVVPSINPVASLTEVICAESNKKKRAPASEAGDSQRNYELFVDLIHRMLAFDPEDRIKPEDALNHGFIRSGEQSQSSSPYPGSQASTRRSDASSTEGASRPRKDAPTKRTSASQQQPHPPR